MKTTISFSSSSLESESLVAVVLDHAEPTPNQKDGKPQLQVASTDPAVQSGVSADLLLERAKWTGKPFETNLMHRPVTVMAWRLCC